MPIILARNKPSPTEPGETLLWDHIAFGSIMKEGGVTHNALVWNEYNQCGAGITFNGSKEAEPMPIPQRHSRQDPLVSLSEVKPPSSERSWGKYSCTRMR